MLLFVIDTPGFKDSEILNNWELVILFFHPLILDLHSLGVAYLSRVMIENIKQNNPVTNKSRYNRKHRDIGLYHDLGHGPFSHLFMTYYKRL